jgi:hypothetical protein
MPHDKLTFLFFFLLTQAFGQTIKPDSSFVQAARSQAVATYEQTLRLQAHVYEGNEYITHDHRIKIHPYYRVDSLLEGTVSYNGVNYRNVRMQYDIVRDELAVQLPENGYRLQPQTDKISAFSMGPYQFTRIVGDSAAGVPTGFYEILYDGRIKALAHRAKTVHEDISGGFYKADYLPADRFFILKEGAYHGVKTKRSVLSLFPDQAKALRKYLRTNKLKFNDELREAAITRTVQHYDELTK